jgi:hypothetical protein
MTSAPEGETKPEGAVIATSPASMPLAHMPGSGFLNGVRFQAQNIAATAPAAEASMVFTATTEMRRSVAARVEPGLNPNQPNARMKVPSSAIGRLCGASRFELPSLLNLPSRGPITIAPARPVKPPMAWTTPEPAKST